MAKACTECSRKKIRCDGLELCLNCRNSGSKCVYKLHKERRPRVKKSDSVAERLARLENLMGKIATKFEVASQDQYGSPTSLSGSKHDPLSLDVSSQLSPSTGVAQFDKKLEHSAASLTLSPRQADNGFFAQCKSIVKESLGPDVRDASNQRLVIHYKGTHLGFSVLGDKSTQYLRERLRPEDHYITVPLQTLPFYFTTWKKAFQSVWSEPQVHTAEEIAKLKEGNFPAKLLVEEILLFYKHAHLASFVLEFPAAQELFSNYYAPRASTLRRNLNYSELMLMCLALATSLSLIIDQEALQTFALEDCPLLRKQLTTLLVKLQEEMFMNSVYYYHRISAISEGIPSILALLLMSVYLETSWVISDVNFTLVSLAIRYAQEMGLHVYELSADFPVAERVARLKLWSACQCFDVEICYRLGKPPLLTPDDDSKSDLVSQEYNKLFRNGCQDMMTANGICGYNDKCADMVCFFEEFQSLSQLRIGTYHTLFGSSFSFKGVKQVQDLVSTINAKSFAFAAEIEEAHRPKLYHEPGFDEFLQLMSDGTNIRNVFCMLLSMTYFSHLMTVNRVPWQVVVDESEVPARETPEFRRLSLDSARTILHLIRIVDKKSWPFMTLNWMLVFPFLAAMNLCANCMNHASDKETFKDLSLLIDVSMNFFGYFGNICMEEDTKLHYMRFQLVDLLLRVLLRVIIKVIEERNNMNILDGNEELTTHLVSAEKSFPHIYKYDHSGLTQFYSEVPVKNFLAKHPHIFPDDFPLPSDEPQANQYTPSRPSLSLADILHPDFKAPDSKPKEAPLEDDMNYMSFWTQEMVNMPNFFFDNGL